MGRRRTGAKLYQTDLYAWTKRQAEKLRRLEAEHADLGLDLPHIADEIDYRGDKERDTLSRYLRRIIECCLKIEWSPALEARASWRMDIFFARILIEGWLTPSLSRALVDDLPRLYDEASKSARTELEKRWGAEVAAALPAENPYVISDLLASGWYPAYCTADGCRTQEREMTAPELYEADFYAWTKIQAERLRRLEAARVKRDLDLPRLAEEVEDLGKSERDAVLSQLERIVEHCLKLEFSTAREPRTGWLDGIDDARGQIAYKLTRSLRAHVAAQRARVYGRALGRVRKSLHRYGEAPNLPVECPYTLDELLDDEWYPADCRGLEG